MEALERRLNRNLDPNTEKFIMEEYMYLPQITGAFAYLRGYWIPLSFLWLVVSLIFIVAIGIMFVVAALDILEISFSWGSFLIHAFAGCVLLVIIMIILNFKRPSLIKVFTALTKHFEYDESYDTFKAKVWIENGKKVGKKLNVAFVVHFFVMAVTFVFFTPILDNLQGIDIENTYIGNTYKAIPMPLWFPIKLEEPTAFYVFYILDIMVVGILLAQLLTAILFVFTFFEYMNIELKILIDSIENVENRALKSCIDKYEGYDKKMDRVRLYKDERFLGEYKMRIRENFIHHQQLLKFQLLVDELARWPLFFTAINISIGMACGMLSVMKGDTRLAPQLNSSLLLIMEIASITVICKRGTLLTTMAQSLHMSFYKTRWIHLPQNIKSSILIFQEMTKNYMVYKAGGITPVNWEFHTTIMNSAYTYFNLVFATKESK